MANLFFLNTTATHCDFPVYTQGVDKLIAIQKTKFDSFYKNSQIYKSKNYIDLCQNFSQENQARLIFIEQLSPLEKFPKKEKDLDKLFPGSFAGFLGIDFNSSDIKNTICVADTPSFKNFKSYCQNIINSRNFWELKEECFSKLTFCKNTRKQIEKLGTSDYFAQVMQQLIKVNDFLILSKNDPFSYKRLKDQTAIDISPESPSTLAKFGEQRVFPLPSGGTALFDLHIKCGDIRIHVLQKEEINELYIGYIGKHLDTVTG